MTIGFKYENHHAATLNALLNKLEKNNIVPGHIIAIIDTGEEGNERWRAATWHRE